MNEVTVTRRNALGAIAAVGAIGFPGDTTASSSSRDMWEARFGAYQASLAGLLQFKGGVGGEEAFGDAVEATIRACEALVDTPAPDLRAAADKLAVLINNNRGGGVIELDQARAVLADIERLGCRPSISLDDWRAFSGGVA